MHETIPWPWVAAPSANRLADVRDTSLGKLVRDDVLELILRGALRPGQRINEPDIAARLQVSRVPVREALRELESSGLVVARKNVGVFVCELDAKQVADLYELRSVLDAHAGRTACALPAARRAAVLAQLEAALDAMRRCFAAHDVSAYYAANLRFHWTLVEASDNTPLTDTYRQIVQRLHVSRLQNLSSESGRQASIDEHAEIVGALADGDGPRCAALLEAHVGAAHKRLPPSTPENLRP